ncbi:MAG: CPBP family intramembrane metalloprotease [Lachnospiraceae bacterium]|nr:CPBP family intramembrane metalloprotease [Lachnospiraceae bacterium]
MEKLSNQERLKPWMGFVLFGIGLAFLVSLGSFLQATLGLWGLVLTELGFLGISLLFCVIKKVKIKEVLPIKKVTGMDVLGVLFMTAGAFLLNLLAIGISMLFVKNAGETISELSNFLYGSKTVYALLLLIVAILPAICEESFMRGAVLSCFRGLNDDFVICFLIGLMFGALHLDALRFLNTACLGAVLAYVMVKKNNIILPMMIHFINNFISSVAGFITMAAGDEAGDTIAAATSALENIDPVSQLGSYLLVGFAAPILLVLGAMFLDRKGHKPKRFLVAGIISGVLLFSGVVITSLTTAKTLLGGDAYLNWNSTFEVTEETLQGKDLAEAGIDFEEEKTCMLVVSATGSGGELTFTVTDENGNTIVEKSSSSMLIVSEMLQVEPGHYTLAFTGDEDLLGKTVSYQVLVK